MGPAGSTSPDGRRVARGVGLFKEQIRLGFGLSKPGPRNETRGDQGAQGSFARLFSILPPACDQASARRRCALRTERGKKNVDAYHHIGNEKGGSGQIDHWSMHVSVALSRGWVGRPWAAMRSGFLRQLSFGRYNSRMSCLHGGGTRIDCLARLHCPCQSLIAGTLPRSANLGTYARMSAVLEAAQDQFDFLLIDCPGSHNPLQANSRIRSPTR